MLQSKNIIGQMDCKVTILQPVTAKNNYGEDIPTWGTLTTVWAKLEDSPGDEHYQADQLTAVKTVTFTIRYLSTVQEKMRVSYRGKLYNITSISRPDRKTTMILKADLLDDNG